MFKRLLTKLEGGAAVLAGGMAVMAILFCLAGPVYVYANGELVPAPAAPGAPAAEPAPAPAAGPSAGSKDFGPNERFPVFEIFKTKEQKSYRPEATVTVSPLARVIVRITDFLVKVVGAIAVLVFVAGSLLLITAQGRENQIQMGKDTLFFAIVGVIIVFFSYMISVFVQSIFF